MKDMVKNYEKLKNREEALEKELDEALEEDSNEEEIEKIPKDPQKIREEKKKFKKNNKKINMLKILLKAVFGDLFNIVIDSSSEDNYKWLPENLNRNIVNMNFGIEDLPKDKNYIETVCMGVTHESGEAIKNNAKILEYLLKNGVRAYNSEMHRS